MPGPKAVQLTSYTAIDRHIKKLDMKATVGHAQNVSLVVLPLAQGVRMRIKLPTDTVHVRTLNGKPVNVCWVKLSGAEYYFCFNRTTKEVEIYDQKKKNNRLAWSLRHHFQNSTPGLANAIKTAVANL